MNRYLDELVLTDLATKVVVLTGPRQVGKTTLSRQLMQSFSSSQYLNWDVLADRAVMQRQSWNPRAGLLVMDEIHKMPNWKAWLKGVADGRAPGQTLMVTGSARMDTFRRAGESLAGRYFSFRLHPISVREWCVQQAVEPAAALDHLLARGGFPPRRRRLPIAPPPKDWSSCRLDRRGMSHRLVHGVHRHLRTDPARRP